MSECDCAHYAYEQGHPCFTQCSSGTGGGDHEWYTSEIASHPEVFDTGISEAQWIAWRPYWDQATHSFRTENVDSAGKAIGGTGFSKPVDCPEGTTKFYINQCLPPSDWRVAAAAPSGTAQPKATAKAAAPPAPAPRDLTQLPYTTSDLQNVLADMFNYRAGVFGTKSPDMWGATSRAPAGQDISGSFTPEGGVWWGGSKDMADALQSFGTQFKTTGGNVAQAQPASGTGGGATVCPPGKHLDATGKCVADVSTNLPAPPVQLGTSQFMGPLATALSNLGRNQFRAI